jgi:chromosome segregation ATPase
MNRLATVEAYRMCAVVDQALEHLDLLSRMPATDLSGLSGMDPALEMQQAQEHRFLSLHREARRMGAADSKDLSLAGINVRSATRELVRTLKTKQDLRASILSYCADPSQPGASAAVAHLSSTLDKLKQLVEKKLCTTVEQQESRNGYAAELATHARELEKDIEELESQLKEERVKTERDLTYHSEIISKLNAELSDIRQKTDATRTKLEKETNTERAQNLEVHDLKVKEFNEEIGKLTEKQETQSTEQTTNEENARKKKTKLETEVTNLVAKYDADLGVKQGEIDEIKGEYDKELARLEELTKFFDKVDADKANEAEEEGRIEAERQRLRASLERLAKAAARIQALCRGVLTRSQKKKGGKNGKKGGKKKKK